MLITTHNTLFVLHQKDEVQIVYYEFVIIITFCLEKSSTTPWKAYKQMLTSGLENIIMKTTFWQILLWQNSISNFFRKQTYRN